MSEPDNVIRNRFPEPAPEPGKELERAVFEGEIVEEDDPAPVLVDRVHVPTPVPVWSQQIELAPVVSPWITDADQRKAAARWWVRSKTHTLTYHSLRSPLYAGRLLRSSPLGFGRAVVGTTAWVRHAELTTRLDGVTDDKAIVALVKERSRERRVRWAILTAALLGGVAGWWVTGRSVMWWDQPLAVLAALAALGVIGRRRDQPIVSKAVVRPDEKPLRSEHIEDALRAVGIKDPVHFVAPIQVDGPGWRADLDLPLGVTATDVMEKRKALASGLRRPLGAVWPGPDTEAHEGRLVLWVGRQPMNKMKAPAWPLSKAGEADLFRPVPFGHDQRGRLVTVTLMFANMLIGAMPRQGKTFALRVLLLACALDTRVQLRAFELKGTGDLSPFETVAHHYASGAGDDAVEDCMASIREVHGLLDPRAKTIRGLPRDVCPESKVTPELAARRNLGLFPVVLAVDECQVLFAHPQWGKEAGDLCTDIIKRGPALGIILLLATQRPDAESLPKGISANAALRFCLRVMGYVENDMVLGTSMYKNGIRATTFTPSDKGIGYLIGDKDDPEIVRTSYLDAPAAERIVARAHKLREAAGTLSGYALGEQEFDTGPDVSLLHDLLQVLGAAEDQAHSADLCERLAAAWPARYGGWDATTLAMALKPHRVATKQVRAGEDGRNGRGITRESLLDALDEPRSE
jgi:S-DNA-T family DNA segregation ATPase FtsK/SpoIIIE